MLFHGCGGMRPHLPLYAAVARAAGWRAFIVDCYRPRGWGRAFALATVCTGASRGADERVGDVLAAIQGVSARPDVDATKLGPGRLEPRRLGHHGGDERRGEPGDGLRRPDPEGAPIVRRQGGLAGLSLCRGGGLQPDAAVAALPEDAAVVTQRDHLTTVRNAEQVNAMVRNCGAQVESWVAGGTHGFDEP